MVTESKGKGRCLCLREFGDVYTFTLGQSKTSEMTLIYTLLFDSLFHLFFVHILLNICAIVPPLLQLKNTRILLKVY